LAIEQQHRRRRQQRPSDNAAPLYDQAIEQLDSPAKVMALLRMASTKPRCRWKPGDEIADVTRLGKLRESRIDRIRPCREEPRPAT
jgi:hypothetical protein